MVALDPEADREGDMVTDTEGMGEMEKSRKGGRKGKGKRIKQETQDEG